MRVLFIAHNGHPYGANKSLNSVMEYMQDKHEIMLFTPFKNSFLEDKNIKNKNIYFFPSVFFVKKSIKYLLYPLLMCLNILIFPYLLIQLNRFKPDIIYSNSSVENMGKILSLFSKAKYIVHVREFGNLDYNFICVLGNKFKRKLLTSSDGLIFNSNIVKETIFPDGITKIPNEVIYNGIGTINYEKSPQSNRAYFKVGIVGYIHQEKGQLDAVKYMTNILLENKNVFLHIIGTGKPSYIKEIKNYIIEHNIEKQVFFDGFIKDANTIYKELDISLVFSRNEAFGRVTIESMARGIPVVAYNRGGSVEIIDNKQDGILFDTNADFELSFNQLYNDKCFYEFIQQNGIEKIKTKFTQENYVTQIEKFIIELYENSLHIHSRNT